MRRVVTVDVSMASLYAAAYESPYAREEIQEALAHCAVVFTVDCRPEIPPRADRICAGVGIVDQGVRAE